MRHVSFLDVLNVTSIALPVSFGVPKLSKLDINFKLFWLYLVLGLLVGCFCEYLYYLGKANIAYFHAFTFIEGLTCFYLAIRWAKSGVYKLIVKVCMIILSAFFVYFIHVKNNWWEPVSEANILRDFMLIPALVYLCYDISVNSKVDLLENSVFWIAFSFLINISISTIQSSLGMIILPGNIYALHYTIYFMYFANFIAYILIIIGFLCYRQRQTSSALY